MKIDIIGFRLPTATPFPSRHSYLWVGCIMHNNKEIGWCNLIFPTREYTVKYEDSFVHPDYRGRGIYKMLFERRENYVESHLKGWKIISYCKPTTLDFFKKRGFIEKEIITLVEKTV